MFPDVEGAGDLHRRPLEEVVHPGLPLLQRPEVGVGNVAREPDQAERDQTVDLEESRIIVIILDGADCKMQVLMLSTSTG